MTTRKTSRGGVRGGREPASGTRRSAANASGPKDELRVSRLDQVRVLADPLRLRMLEAFGEEPRTTKQVAGLLGEKPTRLYHHVDALARAGLIALHHTRQNRGTVEKYYTAVARRFEVGHELFASHGAAAESSSVAMIRTVVDGSRREVLDYFGREHGKPVVPPLVARATIKAPQADLKKLHDELRAILTRASAKPKAAGGEERQSYVLSIFFHPVPEESE